MYAVSQVEMDGCSVSKAKRSETETRSLPKRETASSVDFQAKSVIVVIIDRQLEDDGNGGLPARGLFSLP